MVNSLHENVCMYTNNILCILVSEMCVHVESVGALICTEIRNAHTHVCKCI